MNKTYWLKRICENLIRCDSNIVEIIQYGSSVYAPEYARDVDILILTKKAKDYEVYLDAIEEIDPPFNVDVNVIEIGQGLSEEFIRGILGAFKMLYGDGKYILEYAKVLSDPTFKEAKIALRAAKDYLELALKTSNTLLRDRHIREAFDTLFHAARIAVMTYLSTEITRWGLLKKMLPKPYDKQFKKFINILHLDYFYHGRYPKDNVKDEFNKWYEEVKSFIENLEIKSKKRK